MGQATVNLKLNKSAYIKEENPNTHYSTAYNQNYQLGASSSSKENYLLLGFEPMATNLKRKKLLAVQLTAYLRQGNGALNAYPLYGAFNAANVTWNTKPSQPAGYIYVGTFPDPGYAQRGTWATLTAPTEATIDTTGAKPWYAINYGISLGGNTSGSISEDVKNWYGQIGLGSSTPMYITITYDPDVTVTSQVDPLSYPSGSSVSSAAAQRFSWRYRKAAAYSNVRCADETWTQASAKFYWKTSEESSYHQTSISGTTLEHTFPANTFPAGKTINWYVQGTDTDGTTTTSGNFTFTTIAPVLTPTSYPSGSSVDSRAAIPFAWNITEGSSGASMTQVSAKLYWRVSGATGYNEISVSGNTKSLTVPAYTFPPNTTIEWYLSATVPNNITCSSSSATFKTQTFSISILSAPTGSDIDTRNAISFSWKIANSSGDATQTSAVFYWRTGSTESYTQVSISGNTKNVSIPANTFPTGKTVQWYVSATVQGGTVLSTSPASFTTVSTQITMDTYPSGNSVYTAAGLGFTWHFASSAGNYGQSSAKLYWRSSTSDPYSQISVSGNTQSLTVPANTFPTGKTIQWYMEGTDIGGKTSSTSVSSFTTVTTQITPQDSPTSGYADPREAITFHWYFASSGGSVPQGSATFYWRETGEEEWTSVSASGSSQEVTIPANTFPVASYVEWYLTGTDIGGTSSTSEVFTFSTTASTAYAYPQAPIGIAQDTSKPVTLSWMLANADGTLQKKVTLQWKRPTDISWTTIRQSATPFTEWEVEANYFPVGEIEWRVIATNRDNIDGPAGTAAFVSVHAPAAPIGVTATAVPLTTISWQAEDQEGFEIFIDGVAVKRAYGTDSSWSPDWVLEDGTHVISVRIQGLYGLWSDPGSTTVAIENIVPEGWEDLAVSAAFDVDAEMTATGAEDLTSPTINWFRDGKRIAVTEGLRSYTDRFVLGTHSYYIEIWSPDGYYARSVTVTGCLKSCTMRIALFSGGEWIDLKYSERSDNEQAFSYNRTASLRHVLGAVYPVLEVSAFEDESGRYSCAFADIQSAKRFESLRGQQVIVKSRGGNVLIGALLSLERRYTEFYVSYSFTIQAIDWEDFRHVCQND